MVRELGIRTNSARRVFVNEEKITQYTAFLQKEGKVYFHTMLVSFDNKIIADISSRFIGRYSQQTSHIFLKQF